MKKALAALDCGGGGILLLNYAGYDYDVRDSYVGGGIAYYSPSSPCTSLEAVFASIRDNNDIYALNGVDTEPDEDDLEWYEMEKCEPQKDGRMITPYRYYLIGDEIMYFDINSFDGNGPLPHIDRRFSSGRTDPDFPIPLKAGDIVTLGCRPFAPQKHVLLLEVDNTDCCGVRMLHLDEKGLWRNSALKHKHGWGSYRPLLSPLYRLEKYEGELDEDQKLLLDVQSYMRDSYNNLGLFEMRTLGKDGMTAEEIKNMINN